MTLSCVRVCASGTVHLRDDYTTLCTLHSAFRGAVVVEGDWAQTKHANTREYPIYNSLQYNKEEPGVQATGRRQVGEPGGGWPANHA
jgi:hypothetical protein